MKFALNGATTMKADLSTDIRAAQLAGFDFLEIWASKLRRYLQAKSVTELRGEFAASGVKPLSINSIEHITFRTSTDYDRIKTECEELSAIAAALDCPYIVVVPGKLPKPLPERAEIVAESVRVLNQLADLAARNDVALGFEFLGQTDCSVQTLELATEIVNRVDRPNVGLVIDSFHFYAGGSTVESLEEVDPEKLFIFHVNDAEDRPREQLNDSHRLLPGLGILPLREMVESFSRIGYDRVASVEIFRPEYWELDPVELAQDAKAAMATVFGSEKEK